MASMVAKENFHPHYGSFWLKVSLYGSSEKDDRPTRRMQALPNRGVRRLRAFVHEVW